MKKHAIAALLIVATLTLLASCGGAGSGDGEGGNQGTEREGAGTAAQQAQREEAQPDETTGGGMVGMGRSNMDHMDHGPSMGGEEMARRMLEGPNGEYSDHRFIDMMVPHHQGAIDMAEVALENAEHEEILRLSNDIIRTQTAEIEELKDIKQEEFGTSEVPIEMGDDLMRGMGMMMGPQQLAEADPFDRAFIDNMTPHHQSAIDMANVVLDESENPRLRELAENIIEAQVREIAQMERWREEWYPEG